MRFILGFPRSLAEQDFLFNSFCMHWEVAGLDVMHVVFDIFEGDVKFKERYIEIVYFYGSFGVVVIGGFSLGVRIAVQVSMLFDPLGLFCFGYFFYVRGDLWDRYGLEMFWGFYIFIFIV